MGMWACGNGDVVFKDEVDYEIVEEVVKDYKREYNITCDGAGLDFAIDTFCYHEEDLEDFLNMLTPYINEGSASIEGECDYHVRYNFDCNANEWCPTYGKVKFGLEDESDDALIAELESRGYVVKKTNWYEGENK